MRYKQHDWVWVEDGIVAWPGSVLGTGLSSYQVRVFTPQRIKHDWVLPIRLAPRRYDIPALGRNQSKKRRS